MLDRDVRIQRWRAVLSQRETPSLTASVGHHGSPDTMDQKDTVAHGALEAEQHLAERGSRGEDHD